MAGPFARIADDPADVVVDLVAVGVDRIARRVAGFLADGADDVGEDGLERLAGDDAAVEEHLVRPGGDLDLGVGLGVGS